MLYPYLLMALLYLTLAGLAALDAALASYSLLPWFAGLRWLRIHFITLGALTQVIFGLVPGFVAARAGRRRPKMRWDVWAALNAGLLTLLVGIPLVNGALIIGGGTLVFIAAVLLIGQLAALRPQRRLAPPKPGAGLPFYLAGLAYLLLGILVGTGLWVGWGEALRIAVPIEVHIHANNWGFMSLAFAGLLVDLYPGFSGRSMAWPRSLPAIFWMMTVGALGLVLGPWLNALYLSVPGLVLHLGATFWLLANVVAPLRGDRQWRTPGIWHLVTSYVWILAPVLVAPLIILKVPGFPGAGIEQNAPQALIYGWVLQFGYSLLPYVVTRALVPGEPPIRLGGNWLSLVTVHLGGVCLWASIFLKDFQGLLHGTAYAFWLVSLVPMLVQLWQIFRAGLDRWEAATPAPELPEPEAGV
jgi:hypothetical protein